METDKPAERRHSSGRRRAQSQRMLVDSSESDEEDAPEEAPELSRAELDALEEELAAEEDDVQAVFLHPLPLISVHQLSPRLDEVSRQPTVQPGSEQR